MNLWNSLGVVVSKISRFCFSMNAADKLAKVQPGKILAVKPVPSYRELNGKNRLQILADGYEELDEAQDIYTKEIIGNKVRIPTFTDEIAKERIPAARRKLDAAFALKYNRNKENYAAYLEDLIKGLGNGKYVVGDDQRYQISKLEVFQTFSHYMGKLRSLDAAGIYEDVLERAQDAMKKYASVRKTA